MNRQTSTLVLFLALVISLSVGYCRAEPIPCPSGLERSMENALKYCATDGHKLETRSLLGLANISLSLLKQSPLARKLVPLKDEGDHDDDDDFDDISELRKKRMSPLVDMILKRSVINKVESSVDDMLPHEMGADKKWKRHLINISAVEKSSSEEEEITQRKRESPNGSSQLQKELGEVIVCAVQRVIQEQPVLRAAIEECKPASGQITERNKKEFEDCAAAKMKEICPNLKLD